MYWRHTPQPSPYFTRVGVVELRKLIIYAVKFRRDKCPLSLGLHGCGGRRKFTKTRRPVIPSLMKHQGAEIPQCLCCASTPYFDID